MAPKKFLLRVYPRLHQPVPLPFKQSGLPYGRTATQHQEKVSSLSDLVATATSTPAPAVVPRVAPRQLPPSVETPKDAPAPVLLLAAWHSLAWLVFANVVGVLLAALLLLPKLNLLLGPFTYGRWMPVHIDLQLYGWCSLPLVLFLFHAYGADRPPLAAWCRPVLWAWSAALAVGTVSWLTGHSSGKLFLDWTGLPRILFPLSLLSLWILLAAATAITRHQQRSRWSTAAKLLGLALLLAVPILLYIASSPALYPPINPDTGGPTGASQLESTLVIVAILLLLPFGIATRRAKTSPIVRLCWGIFAAEALLCLGLGRADVSHHRPIQYISLGSLLLWLPLLPVYVSAFAWHRNTRRWRIAFLCWWSVLIPTGWCLFLPGVLDHFKFTDGLVAHSLLAMAGFVSSLLIFVMVHLLGEDGVLFNRSWFFYLWNATVALYVALMFFAGWREGSDAAFGILPGALRNALYTARLLLGILLLIASADWLIEAGRILRRRRTPGSRITGSRIAGNRIAQETRA